MKIRRQIEHDHGDSAIFALSDPFFVFKNMFEANVEKWDTRYKVEIPLKGLFYLPFNLVVYVTSVLRSTHSVNYVINVADFAEHRWGIVMFKVREDEVDMEVEVEVPLNIVTSRILRKRVERFAENFNEAVRLYRIEKKI
ncbi:MAG: hypothetical protein ASUL_08449 [Candidatus Aramenus sulfurataquae]|jgi:hypothetical protein|uniref:DUF3211 domain-containing protein n=3 Tax=Candidatus Aramenus sulfurataquae TaxID=1326980 RepID=W7L4X4_9CREN|nr:MAG: hypothetical protein ASUL_08449 [Candidatus Aramenus sulfurataquae]MCL7343895.1 DUF3211 domain-containing protein [Candidatus Aramenus sulfurataquae]